MKNNMEVKETVGSKKMAKFEKELSLIIMPNKIFFLHEWVDKDGEFHMDMKTKEATKDEWANRPVFVKDDDGEIKKISPVVMALNGWTFTSDEVGDDEPVQYMGMERHQGIGFFPDSRESRQYNSFKGFAVEPEKGDISIFTDTMTKVFGEENFSTIMDWFASGYQYPERKVLWAIAARGTKGTGKNTAEEMLGRGLMRSENYFRTSDKNALFGRFTGHLAYNLLLVGQEIVWGGDRDHDSSLKELITETSRKVEKKGVDAFMLHNYTRLYMTSNSDWVVPASGKYERRYFVADTAGDVTKAEWTKLYKWFAKDGSKEALMYEMMNRDLSNFNWHQPPFTEEIREQLEKSLYGVEKFVFDMIEDGEVTYKDNLGLRTVMYDRYNGWKASELYEAFIWRYPKLHITQTRFGRDVLKYLDGGKVRRTGGIYYLPKSRKNCAKFFEEQTNVTPNYKDINKKGKDKEGDWI